MIHAFSNAAYTVKSGEVVVKDGEVVSTGKPKSVIWTDADGFDNKQVVNDVVEKFLKYYSVTLNNYPVQDDYYSHLGQTVVKAGPLAGGN